VALVDGEPVSVESFQQRYRVTASAYRQAFQGNFDAIAARLPRDVLEQLINEQVILSEARRVGLAASPREISQLITQDPAFQVDGRFVGRDRYQRLLRDSGRDATDWEQTVARNILSTKYRRLVTDPITVSSQEVLEEYRSRNEKVKADYFVLGTEELSAAVEVDETALEEFFDLRRDAYQTAERRRAAYVLINAEGLGGLEPVADEEARGFYDDNLERLYSRPAQVRASQILLEVPSPATPEEEEAVRTRAEDLLLRARSGEDFAELARGFSEHSTQTLGGDMGFFGAGSMRPEFEEAAFALGAGEISEVVRSDLGFQIIRVTDRRDASVQPFSEVRDAILRQLEFSRSQDAVARAVNSFRDDVQADGTQFLAAAERLGLAVEDTGLLAADGSVESLGAFPQISSSLFQLNVGGVSRGITLPQGSVFLQSTEIRPPEPLPFEQAREQVEADYRQAEGVLAARRKVEDGLADGGDLAGLAAKLGATVESTVEFTRRQPVTPFTPEARREAFLAPPGEVADPLEVPKGLLVFSVTEHQELEPTLFEEDQENLRRSLVERRRGLLFSSVVQQLRQDSEIQINEALIAQFENRGT
jgi:peptidyl-prolyl cis-trans isomerase D